MTNDSEAERLLRLRFASIGKLAASVLTLVAVTAIARLNLSANTDDGPSQLLFKSH